MERGMGLFHRKSFDYSDGKDFRAAFAQRFIELGGPVQMALFGKPRYATDDDWLLVTDFDFSYIEQLSPGNWVSVTKVRDSGWDLLLGNPEIEELVAGNWLNPPHR
jgi:hypothetical protein